MQKQYIVSLAAAAIGLSLVAAFQNCFLPASSPWINPAGAPMPRSKISVR